MSDPDRLAVRLQALKEKNAQQAKCKHTYRSVPNGSGGFMAYLQCSKCGKRITDD